LRPFFDAPFVGRADVMRRAQLSFLPTRLQTKSRRFAASPETDGIWSATGIGSQ
jgi:hypothetical protein